MKPARLPRERLIDPRTILQLIRKELRDAVRNRWFVSYTIAFALLSLGLAYLSRVGTSMSGFSGFGPTAAAMINLVIMIVPLMALTIGAGSLTAERERGMLAYLLAQPVNRIELILSKFIGLSIALTGSLAFGFGLAGTVLAANADASHLNIFIHLVLLSCVLALSMLAVGVLISTIARRSSAAMGAAILTWLLIVFLGDLGLMGSAVMFRLNAQELFLAAIVNPTQAFKLSVIGGLPTLLIGCLAAWLIVPLVASVLIFSRKPL
ncbi:MAG TPA: ABC transporter permease subunit [Tepidisphaeraceae bacterium]|nr:ABC transporter permease subunit [Tepidisphaeraceae bacterium]